MNVAMITNTYLPMVGGVAQSVLRYSDALRARGHGVLVVAPHFEGAEEDPNVVRVPAIQNFNGSDFSYRIPFSGRISAAMDRFEPDVAHAHHPFLLGDTALRIAAVREIPLVFTHHTMYERYTHYVPGDSPQMKRFAVRLATEFASLCDLVIAPSESIAGVLRDRGVRARVEALPTGIDISRWSGADGAAARKRWEIPGDAFVVGHVGRLAPEKNLGFLARACARFLSEREGAFLLIAGDGKSKPEIRDVCASAGVEGRLRLTGSLGGNDLRDVYGAMDVFAFASTSETQGMVLAEAMACGTPCAALDAPGAREMVENGVNGYLLEREDEASFVNALSRVAGLDGERREVMVRAARRSAEAVSLERCTDRLIGFYEGALRGRPKRASTDVESTAWGSVVRLLETEWKLWSRRFSAAAETGRPDARRPSA